MTSPIAPSSSRLAGGVWMVCRPTTVHAGVDRLQDRNLPDLEAPDYFETSSGREI